MSKIKSYGYDESFKILARHFFERFSKVITDYEIIKLPKKTDVLVVEADSPINTYVKIFDYFKKFNIIEFKSPKDRFSIKEDLPKLFIYIGGIMLNEKAATTTNTTFTLVCSHKPDKLFQIYKSAVQKLKNGVYLIQRIIEVPVYIILVNEVQGELDRELALLKEFTTGQERREYIRAVLLQVITGNKELADYLHFAFCLYKDEINDHR